MTNWRCLICKEITTTHKPCKCIRDFKVKQIMGENK